MQISLIAALLALLFTSNVSSVNTSLRSSRAFSKRAHLAASTFLSLALISAPHVTHAEDCNRDCNKNCLVAAPSSESYCKETCQDYCSDTVQREKDKTELYPTGPDEKDSESGYDRAFLRELNQPPSGPQIIPRETMKNLQLRYKAQEPRKGIFFKDLF